jgi:hypothetical protein
MSNPISLSAALPISRVVLRVLVILNWVYGAAIFALLVISIVNEPWFMSALKFSTLPDADRVLMGLRAITLLGLTSIPLHYIVLKRLLAIVDTVRSGDPFVVTNAHRLQTIAWVLFALNILSIVIGTIGSFISSKAYPVHLDAGFSINGWLAVLLTFVLARVFGEGALMREDLEGTV